MRLREVRTHRLVRDAAFGASNKPHVFIPDSSSHKRGAMASTARRDGDFVSIPDVAVVKGAGARHLSPVLSGTRVELDDDLVSNASTTTGLNHDRAADKKAVSSRLKSLGPTSETRHCPARTTHLPVSSASILHRPCTLHATETRKCRRYHAHIAPHPHVQRCRLRMCIPTWKTGFAPLPPEVALHLSRASSLRKEVSELPP